MSLSVLSKSYNMRYVSYGSMRLDVKPCISKRILFLDEDYAMMRIIQFG